MGCNESRVKRSSRPRSSSSACHSWDDDQLSDQDEAIPLVEGGRGSTTAAAPMGQPASSPRLEDHSRGPRHHHLVHYHHPGDGAGQTPLAAPALSALATQHERLVLELLPVKDAQHFHEWLRGPMVWGSWREFWRDFQSRHPLAPEVDKARVSQAARDAINNRQAKYVAYYPEKNAWSHEDHAVRFIVCVVADNLLGNMWSDSDWRRKPLDITKAVFEVLTFLRSTAPPPPSASAPEPNPPDYTA